MNKTDSQITSFIYKHPDIAANILQQYGYHVQTPLTLPNINKAMFTAIYGKINIPFLTELDKAISSDGYSNFIAAIITGVVSIVTSMISANTATKARELQEKITLANLANAQLLTEENIRTQAETDRTKILLETIAGYNKDLQTQSTTRLNNTGLYVIMTGISIAIIYGMGIILTEK